MATHTLHLEAPVERVFGLLEDPRSLAAFVVGNRTIRNFDPRWPEPGTVAHHTVGVGPLSLRDSVEVVDVSAPHRLVLEARFRPLGVMAVTFLLSEVRGGTELTMEEHPIAGPAALPGVAVAVDGLLWLRNLEMARRIRRLTGERERQGALAGPAG